ncbi:MAG: phosphatase PAP2 family protein [Neisseriaceae bacterium]|nr:phosphatase PAP2 family protein [Neisseriaceae bacterium]
MTAPTTPITTQQTFPLSGWPTELAQFIGYHAPTLYLTLLALVLLGTLLAFFGWRCLGPNRRRRMKRTYAVLGMIGFGFIAYQVMAFKDLPKFDALTAFYISVHASFTYLDLAAKLSYLAQGWVMAALAVLIGALLWWRHFRTEAVVYVLSIAGNGVLNTAIKIMAQRARPPHLHGVVIETGYSFPSGHSSGAMATYAMLAFILCQITAKRWHLLWVLLASALIVSIGFSRIYLQVHFISDVIAGFTSGSIWVLLCVAIYQQQKRLGK